ncbi:glycosyltransferase family 4 protein [Flavisolibacter sp. BT320]|nr:glycosyltransferase family 4 protein [Flavisolibacter longurius]
MRSEPAIKILFIHTYYKQRGGEDQAFESDVALFRKKGYEVNVLTFSNRRNSFLKFLFFPFNVVSYVKTLAAIKRFGPTVVHIHNLFFAASPSILYAIKRSNVPAVLTVHNFRFFCPSGTLFNKNGIYTKSIGTGFPWQAVKDKVYNGYILSTLLVAFSFWLHKHLKSWNKIDTLVFLNGYAKDLFEKNNPILFTNRTVIKANAIKSFCTHKARRDNSFVFIGRLSPEKGILFLLEAFSNSSLTLKVIGDGGLKGMVQAAAERCSNIEYLGYQKKEFIDEQLNQCGALVMGSGCMEMAPLAVVEALACGTPVIAPDILTLQSIVIDGYNGLLYKFNDIDSFRQTIENYISLSEADKKCISRNARQYYEANFTEDACYKAGKAIYQDVINSRNKMTKR